MQVLTERPVPFLDSNTLSASGRSREHELLRSPSDPQTAPQIDGKPPSLGRAWELRAAGNNGQWDTIRRHTRWSAETHSEGTAAGRVVAGT